MGRLSRSYWKERITDRRWKALSPRWTLPSGLDVVIHSEAEWIVYNDLFVDGEYDPAILPLVEKAKSGQRSTILDLGANVGYFVLRVSDLFLRARLRDNPFSLVAVEAMPRLCARLEENLPRNPFGSAITVRQGLVGLRQGEGEIADTAFHIGNRVGGPGRTTRVPYIDLDGLVQGGDGIDLVKCDIEGSEEAFLENYPVLLARTNTIVIEFHDQWCDTKKCRALLDRAGLTNRSVIKTMKNMSVELFSR